MLLKRQTNYYIVLLWKPCFLLNIFIIITIDFELFLLFRHTLLFKYLELNSTFITIKLIKLNNYLMIS